MANNIVEFNIDGTSYTQRPYGTCSTAAGTAAKVVTCSGFNLVTGATVMVKFTNANTVANPTLNVNSKGAKAIYYRGAALTASSLANWGAGDVVEFRYNGTQWDLLNVGNTAGEGEANVQSDWNVTDTTSDAYIKNKPTIPTIGNGTITIKQNGASKGTFTVNQTGDTTIELTDTGITSQDHYKTSVTAGTAGTSSATSGSTLAVPYVTVNANGHVTGYGTHTHTISGFLTSETYKGTVTKVSTGAGLTGGDITSSGTIKCKLNSETSLGTIGTTSKLYAVGVDANGKLCVPVPWTDTDTDTKVTQTVTTSNANYPLLLAPSGQTATATTTSYFASGLTYNPSTGKIENDDPLILSGNAAAMELDGSDVVFTLDDDGVVRTTSANNTSLGNSTYPWKALYATTIYEGGTALSSKYQAKGTYATSDTKNTAGSTNTTSKIYLIGATSQAANPQTYSHSSVYVETVSSTSHLVSTGGFYESSDERLKDFGEGLKVDLDALSKLRKSYFTFKDKPEDPQIGVSAQEIQKLYPEVVIETSDGHLNVDYAKLSVVALAAIDQLNDKVKSLEDRLVRLEKLLENK